MNLTYRRTVKPGLTATSSITAVIRSPRYHGHFVWPPKGQNGHTFSCKKETLVITATLFGLPRGKTAIHFLVKKNPRQHAHPLIRPNVLGPLVTVLTGFHRIINVSSRVFKGIDQILVNLRILSVAHHRFQSPTPNPITTSKPYDRSVLLLYGGS